MAMTEGASPIAAEQGSEGTALIPPESIAGQLKAACADEWDAYTRHAFVRELGDGTLPEACFRHYLVQDYIFLMHFARAYALAVFKSETLEDMRQAAATVDVLMNAETILHIEYCGSWGLSEAEMVETQEAGANLAYTRYVLEKGHAGDLLDLLVALAPCVLGYGEVGLWLKSRPETVLEGNPYRAWIETYSGEDYLRVARAAVTQLDRVAARRIGSDVRASGRWPALVEIFRTATRLEAGFWNMGLNPPAGR